MKYDPKNYTDEIADVLAMGDRLRNWGRWGADDQKGTANLIRPEHRVHAASLVKRGVVISLALPIRNGEGPTLPFPAGRFNPIHTITVTGDKRGPFDMGETTDFTDDIITMGLQRLLDMLVTQTFLKQASEQPGGLPKGIIAIINAWS